MESHVDVFSHSVTPEYMNLGQKLVLRLSSKITGYGQGFNPLIIFICEKSCKSQQVTESDSQVCEGFPGGSVVKNLPAMQEMRVQSLGQEDPMEKETATHSTSLAWEIPCTEEPGGLQSMGLPRVKHE